MVDATDAIDAAIIGDIAAASTTPLALYNSKSRIMFNFNTRLPQLSLSKHLAMVDFSMIDLLRLQKVNLHEL